MMLGELWIELRRQPIRSCTSLAGIAWGTLSLILLLAFSVGFEALFVERSKGLGDGITIAWPARTTRAWQGLPPGRPVLVSHEDVQALGAAVSSVESISAEFERYLRVETRDKVLRVQVSGVDASFGDLRSLTARGRGRFLNHADTFERRRVIFLGDAIARALFGQTDPVGESVRMGETPFLVVGVLAAKTQDSDYGSRDRDRVFVPASTYRDVWGTRNVNNFVFRTRDGVARDNCSAQLLTALAARLRFDPSDREALTLWDTSEQQRVLSSIFLAFHVVLGIAGLFTLLAGAVGIGNLMFLLVRRRQREIGLKLALGALPSQVRREVLGPTLVLIALGAGIGAALAVGVVALAGAGPWTEDIGVPRIPYALAAACIALISCTGLVAGYFPARAAERVDPITAMSNGRPHA